MATTHAHVLTHVSANQDMPPSPTLTNPDMILPFDERQGTSPTLSVRPPSTTIPTDLVSKSSFDSHRTSTRPRSDSDAEVGIATAVTLPMLVRGRVATTGAAASNAAAYGGYEHGAPLSDIGEEAEETPTRSRGSSRDESRSSSKHTPPLLRHKKRLSNLSSSSGGSDKNEQWDGFDTSQLMSDRVAADIAQARDDAEDNEDTASKRNSKEVEEELAVLNDRAEKILANARKRLSSMEDNLTKARHSILLSPRSIPNMHELGHQPAGGLYRSISQSAQNRRSRGLFPSLKTMGLQHARTGSEMVSTSGLKRLSVAPEPRSASAMDFSPARYGVGFITAEAKPSPPSKIVGHSPSSSRSYNSPLRILAEEGETETPSTVNTSPDGPSPNTKSFLQGRGLGIHASGTKGQEDLTQPYESSESPSSLHRSSSQTSTRSARDLRDQMSEMKSRIADLKNKAQADNLRRRSTQSLRTPSPFLNSSINGHDAEAWYSSAGPSNHQQQSTTPTGQPGNSSRTTSRPSHERKDSALESLPDQPLPPQVLDEGLDAEVEQNPVTPVARRLLNASDGTPFNPTSARTDRNTPNLVNRTTDVYQSMPQDTESGVHGRGYEDAEHDFDTSEDDEGQVASNQEEQIYLNEMLEESLHDIEPEVPVIPGEYFIGDELVEFQAEEAERHEDRLDAFDYENMFLHSAMGTYRGGDSDDSDNESLVTSREDARTPIIAYDDENGEEDDEQTISGEEHSAGEEMGSEIVQGNHTSQPSSPVSMRSPSTPVRQGWSPVSTSSQTRSPLRETVNGRLKSPPQPWIGVGRTKSMETMSSVASYRTAVEGECEDDEEDEDFHDEILNWGNAPVHNNAHGQTQYLPAHGVSAKAQNVLGWPTPPSTSGSTRHLSYIRPQQANAPGGHTRSISGSSVRSAPARSPLSNVQYSAFPFPASAPIQPPPNQPLPPPPPQAQGQAAVTHQANTEILMESLIKLADPEFSIESTGRSNFADVDKELVLGLLRAVGGVCDSVLRAQHGRRGNVVKELRARLADAKDVLVGVTEQEGLEEILEDDEDDV